MGHAVWAEQPMKPAEPIPRREDLCQLDHAANDYPIQETLAIEGHRLHRALQGLQGHRALLVVYNAAAEGDALPTGKLAAWGLWPRHRGRCTNLPRWARSGPGPTRWGWGHLGPWVVCQVLGSRVQLIPVRC